MVLPENLLGWLIWYSPVVVLLPAYLLLFAWARMRSSPTGCLLVLIGAALFASVPIQEYIETDVKAAANGPGWQRPVLDILLEEGTELAGMICFLIAFSIYAVGRAQLSNPGEKPRGAAVRMLFDRQRYLLTILALLFLGTTGVVISTYFLPPDEIRGTAQNWFPSALSFLAALVTWHTGDRSALYQRLPSLSVAIASLVISAYAGGNFQALSNLKLKLAVILTIALACAIHLLMRNSRTERALVLVWGGLSMIAIGAPVSGQAESIVFAVASAVLLATPVISAHAKRSPAILGIES